MKTPTPLVRAALCATILLAVTSAFAQLDTAEKQAAAQQNGEIKVTMMRHDDGSHTDIQKDFSTNTGEEKTYDAKDKLIQRVTYSLTANAEPNEGIVYNAKGVILYQFAYTRDTMGRISEENDTSSDGKPLRRLVYHYNAAGMISGIDGYDGQGNLLPSTSSQGATSSKKKKH